MTPQARGLTEAEWAQVAAAVFTALAALAALWTVIRAERDRADRALPAFHMEPLQDIGAGETRLTIVNFGGPAREVRIAGVHGTYGYAGVVGPTAFWRPGETRTVHLGVPTTGVVEDVHAIVIARDVRKRYLLVATAGGATHRWPLRKSKKLSTADVFAQLFPGVPSPPDAKSVVRYETVDRAW